MRVSSIIRKYILTIVVSLISGYIIAQPAVIVHPNDISTCTGNTIEFTIVASNTTSYQWEEYDGSGWFPIDETVTYASGENTATLTISDAIIGLNNYKYKCKVSDDIGNWLFSNEALLTVWESPLIIENPINQSVCKTEIATFIIVSEYTSFYQWQENRGTGWYDLEDNSFYTGSNEASLKIYTIFGIDDYQYRCLTSNDNCEVLSEVAILTVYPIPQVFEVIGGGEICEDSDGAEIYINDSENDITYVLIKDGSGTGDLISGTGQSISFGLYTEEGTYEVRATDPDNGCSTFMYGSAIIAHAPSPEVFDVTGDGQLCEDNIGSNIVLSDSELGTFYRLLLNGIPTGNNLEGTGEPLVYPNIVTEGIYTINATTVLSCTSYMNGYVEVSSNPLPIIYNISGGGYICEGASSVSIILDHSEEGVQYELLHNSIATGNVLMGNDSEIIFEDINTPGEYTIIGQNTTTECEQMMNGFATIFESEHPEKFDLIGGGNICEGENGLALMLAGSQENCIYEIYKNNISTEIIIDGTGTQLFLGIFNEEGLYTVQGKFYESGCESWMQTETEITTTNQPNANAGPDIVLVQGASTTLLGSATGDSDEFTYLWEPAVYLNSNTIASPSTIDLFTSQYFTLVVTEIATGCQSLPDTAIINVGGGILEVNASSNTEDICLGEEVQLFGLASGGTGLYQYSWSSIPTGFSSNLVNPTDIPSQNIKYVVSVSDGLTIDKDTVEITINPSPQMFNINGSGTYCTGDNDIHINLSNSEIGVIYYLYKNGVETIYNYTGTGSEINIYDISGNGVYTIYAILNSGECITEMNGYADIQIIPKPVAYAGGQYIAQIGETVNLSGSAFGYSENYEIQWEPADQLISPNSLNTETLELYSSSLFNLIITDVTTGCISQPDTALVSVTGDDEILNIILTTSYDTICEGESTQIIALASGGNGNYSYTWTSDPEGFGFNTYNPIVFPTITTTYYLTVTDGSYSDTDSIIIHINPKPQQFVLSGGGFYCQGDVGPEIVLSGSEIGVYYELLLYGNSINQVLQGTGSELSFGNFTSDGKYTVIANSNSHPCITEMETYVVISSSFPPEAFAGNDQTIPMNQSTILNGNAFVGSGNYTFTWTPSDLFINPNLQSAETNNITESNIIQLKVLDNQSGCWSQPDTLLLNVSGGDLTANTWANVDQICTGENVQLFVVASGGSGSYEYSWSSDPIGFGSNMYNPIVSPTTNTTYYVNISDGTFSQDFTIEITVNDSPTVNAGPDLNIGLGGTAILSGNATGGNNDYSWEWSPSGLVTAASSQTTSTVHLYNDYSFTLRVEDGNNCKSQPDTVKIQVNGSSLNVTAVSLPEQVCYGSDVYLYALPSGGSEDYSFSWVSDPSGFTSANFAALTTVYEDTRFIVTVNDGEYTAQSTIMVKVNPLPERFNIEGNGIYCSGSEGSTIELTGSEDGIIYYLNENGFANGNKIIGDGNSLIFENIQQESSFTIIAVDTITMCSDRMNGSLTITEAIPPIPFLFSGGGLFCEGEEEAGFSLSSSQQGIHYTLYFNDIPSETILLGTGGAIQFEDLAYEGQYHIIAEDPANGCETFMNGEIFLDTYPTPNIDAGDDVNIYLGNSVELEAIGDGTFIWNTPEQHQTAIITVNPIIDTEYIVTAINENNCSNTDTVMVFVESILEPIANAFTPNEDGKNDRFLVDCEIIVINRWGQELYHGKEGWDGRFNGKYVTAGTYYYVRLTDKAGNAIEPIKGSVTVIAPGIK